MGDHHNDVTRRRFLGGAAAGVVGPLPVGLSFFGPAWTEARLLALAFAYEQATRQRKPPRFLAQI